MNVFWLVFRDIVIGRSGIGVLPICSCENSVRMKGFSALRVLGRMRMNSFVRGSQTMGFSRSAVRLASFDPVDPVRIKYLYSFSEFSR